MNMNDQLAELLIYKTQDHACSYLSEHDASTLFIDPKAQLTLSAYQSLSELGFRRSGDHVYRPDCTSCQKCIPVRINVDTYQASRSQKRVIKQNLHWQYRELDDLHASEVYKLYEQYICDRHRDGDMFPPDKALFHSFLSNFNDFTHYHGLYDGEKLIAVAVTDHLEDGISAIYTFYSTDQKYKSLGTYMILWQIQFAKQLGLQYVYLGYWIKACRKMAYKGHFRPLEARIKNRWITLN